MSRKRCADVAGMLTGLRLAVTSNRKRTLTCVTPELLLWIAAGVDHSKELSEQTGIHFREVLRNLALLQGHKYGAGGNRKIDSPVCLVKCRPHPHRQGKQWVLTEDGVQFLRSCKLITGSDENT